jgi:hypothetical protein
VRLHGREKAKRDTQREREDTLIGRPHEKLFSEFLIIPYFNFQLRKNN